MIHVYIFVCLYLTSKYLSLLLFDYCTVDYVRDITCNVPCVFGFIEYNLIYVRRIYTMLESGKKALEERRQSEIKKCLVNS